MTDSGTEPVAEPTSVDLETLRALVEVDIAYEMKQYTTWATRGPSTAFLNDEEAGLLKKAAFEVRVLHLRNLAEFLKKGRPDKTNPDHSHRLTDVVADHYFDEGWKAKPRTMRLYSARNRERDDWVLRNINAHLAHITRTRVDRRMASDGFDWIQVDPTLILDNFERFMADLQRAHPDRARWFESCRIDMQAMRARLASPVGLLSRPRPVLRIESSPDTSRPIFHPQRQLVERSKPLAPIRRMSNRPSQPGWCCKTCGAGGVGTRGVYCSPACRQAAYRRRVRQAAERASSSLCQHAGRTG